MIEIGKKGKVQIHWDVNPYDYNKEREQSLIAKVSKKYDIPKDRVKIIPNFITLSESGKKVSVASDIISNIQNPIFQIELFKEFLSVNNIDNYDFELLQRIDAEINAFIDYDVYDKYRKYSIKWIKWDNFLSYGEGNYFDFTTLKGLVLLSGNPANQSGKTTFAIDLIHFLLFGKTDKASTLDKIFNKYQPEATEVVVEGCIIIDGEEYVIKRTLSRPTLKKRTAKSKVSQKVQYYRIVGDNQEELEEYIDDKQEENSQQTNKVIKEAIGNESDFDMIICATSANLDELIEKKDTERGRLMSRWIGLMPIEQKDALAREKFNSQVKPMLLSNRYNIETLKQEIEAYKINITTLQENNAKLQNSNDILEKEIVELEERKNVFVSSKNKVDENLLNVDITTLNATLERLAQEGSIKKNELQTLQDEFEQMKEVTFSNEDYDAIVQERTNISTKIGALRSNYTHFTEMISQLQSSEYCPTCGRKYENIDNSGKIIELKNKLEELKAEGVKLNETLNQYDLKIQELKEIRERYEYKSKVQIKISALELKVEQLRNAYKENKQIFIEYNKNNEAIDKNNQLDIQIRNTDVVIKDKRNTKEYNLMTIKQQECEIDNNQKAISEREELITKLLEEVSLVRNWKIYLDMVGKNGISKMVLRKALPIINAQIAQLLSDVCDFTVEMEISEKNDIMFYLLRENVKADLTSASGFERTASALALRAVLGNISTLPRMNILVLDEIFGRVAKENLDNVKTLVDKIAVNYDAIIQVSHLSEIVDWHDTHIVVQKENNVSRLKTICDAQNKKS